MFEFEGWTTDETLAEIRREEEALATYRQDLQEAERRRDDLEAATSDERIASLTERTRRRQVRIDSYESAIRELTAQIGRYERRIANRTAEIRTLERSIADQRSRLARLSGVERYVTLGVIYRLERSIASLQGWVTRDTEYLGLVQDTRETSRRILAGLRKWQTQEATALERLNEMRAELAGAMTRVRSLTELIITESARLDRKRRRLAQTRLTVTVNNTEWGTTEPVPDTYVYPRDAIATVTAKPNKGYDLDYWEIDGTRVEPHPGLTINLLMDTDHTLNAVFVAVAVVVAKLYRIKIRLYNEQRLPTPTGMFQGLFDIDALINPRTGLVDWHWWLTEREIDIAKYHFVGYFKGMAKWHEPSEIDLAYFDSSTGIPHGTDKVKYKYSKNVPQEFITKAEALTVRELIVGESSVQPISNPNPTAENMGVYVERFTIIDANGVIKWDEVREKWVWHPTEEMVKRVKDELKI